MNGLEQHSSHYTHTKGICHNDQHLRATSPASHFTTHHGCCSSAVMEDVPPRSDRSIHGMPPSVKGQVFSRSVHLHPTSVNGPVHFRSVRSVNCLDAYMTTDVYVLSWPYPAEFTHLNQLHSAQLNYLNSAQRNYIYSAKRNYVPSAQ